MTVHHTPRMVWQVVLRKMGRRAVEPLRTRRMRIGVQAKWHIRNRDAYEEGKAFNIANNLGRQHKPKLKIPSFSRVSRKKVTLPKLTFMDD